MFKYRYSVKPENLWVLTMVNIYRSFPAVVNLVFTVSMVLLAVRFWSGSTLGIRVLMAAGILVFPVFQPLLIFFRCRRIVGRMPGDLDLTIDKSGIMTEVNGSSSSISYTDVSSVSRIFNMLIIQTRSKQGFILSDRVMEGQGSQVFDFLKARIRRNTRKSGARRS